MGKLLNTLMFLSFQTGVEMELMEQMPLLEWFANNYKNFGRYTSALLE